MVSTRHLVHNTVGKVIAEWGMRKWQEERLKKTLRQTNIHISRQSLRKALLEELHGENRLLWDHELIDIKEDEAQKMAIHFMVQGCFLCSKTPISYGTSYSVCTNNKVCMVFFNFHLR